MTFKKLLPIYSLRTKRVKRAIGLRTKFAQTLIERFIWKTLDKNVAKILVGQNAERSIAFSLEKF